MKRKEITDVAIIGTGAQAKYILEIYSYYPNINVKAIVKTGPEKIDKKLTSYNIEIIKDLEQFINFAVPNRVKAIVAVAQNRQKEAIIKQLGAFDIQLINAVHPKAIIAKTAEIGKNVLINPGAVIQPFAKIGNGVIIHANVIVEHDCVISDYVNLGPGARLAGWVRVKPGAYIYTAAAIIPKITIGANSIVGAGAVVIRDVPDNVTVAGCPAEIIKKNHIVDE